MEKILIYPYNNSYSPVVRYQELLQDATINSLVSPCGWGISGDRETEDMEQLIVVNDNFEDALQKCTLVWFVEDDRIPLPDTLLKHAIKKSVSCKKKILYTRYKNELEYKEMVSHIPSDLLYKLDNNNIFNDNENTYNACYEINVPVIAVLGTEVGTDKYEVQLSLISELKSRGYKVSAVVSRYDGDMLGHHPFPIFMIRSGMTESEKIIKYNHLLHKIEASENPDVILVGIPGGALEYDERNHNDFGVLVYEISRAVSFDFGIVCLPYFQRVEKMYEDIANKIKERYEIPISAFHLAPVWEDVMEISETGLRTFLTLDRNFIEKKLMEFRNDDILDLTNVKECAWLVDKIIKEFTDDGVNCL